MRQMIIYDQRKINMILMNVFNHHSLFIITFSLKTVSESENEKKIIIDIIMNSRGKDRKYR